MCLACLMFACFVLHGKLNYRAAQTIHIRYVLIRILCAYDRACVSLCAFVCVCLQVSFLFFFTGVCVCGWGVFGCECSARARDRVTQPASEQAGERSVIADVRVCVCVCVCVFLAALPTVAYVCVCVNHLNQGSAIATSLARKQLGLLRACQRACFLVCMHTYKRCTAKDSHGHHLGLHRLLRVSGKGMAADLLVAAHRDFTWHRSQSSFQGLLRCAKRCLFLCTHACSRV